MLDANPKLDAVAPDLRKRMRSLLALAQDVGAFAPERETADRALGRLLAKHELTLDDLAAAATDESRLVWLHYADAREKEVATLVGAEVLGQGIAAQWIVDAEARRRRVGYRTTPARAAELAVAWEVYRAAWRSAVDDLFTAFRVRHDLLVSSVAGDVEAAPEPDAATKAKANRALRLAEHLEAVPRPSRRIGA